MRPAPCARCSTPGANISGVLNTLRVAARAFSGFSLCRVRKGQTCLHRSQQRPSLSALLPMQPRILPALSLSFNACVRLTTTNKNNDNNNNANNIP